MARIRTIKPEFWADEKIGSVSRDARLLFIGMWNFSDDFGVIRGNPKLLKAQIFTYDDDLRTGTISNLIDALVNARMLIPFTVRGESYLYIRTFNDHQLVEKPSHSMRLVAAEELAKAIQEESKPFPDPSPTPPRPLPVGMEGNGREGKGREREPSAQARPHSLADVESFLKDKREARKFWDHFCSNGWKVGGKAPMKDWQAAARNWMDRAGKRISQPPQKQPKKQAEDDIKRDPIPKDETKKILEDIGIKPEGTLKEHLA